MVKITSPAPGKEEKHIIEIAPAKEHKHIVRKESLIEIPLGREGRVYSSTTTRPGVHHHHHSPNSSVPRCFLWIIMALSACSLTFMGVRTVGTLRMRVTQMAQRIDVLRSEKALLETVVNEKISKSQFLAKIYTVNDILSFVDPEPEPLTDRWSFNINVYWTSDYISRCNMYWLSRNIADRIYDRVVQVPRVIEVVKDEDGELMKEVDKEISMENEMIEENKLIEELDEEDKTIEELFEDDEFSEEKEVLDLDDIGGSGLIDESDENIIASTTEDYILQYEAEANEEMIAGGSGEDIPSYNLL